MPEITLIVKHKVGLHMRPATLFVATAQSFQSEISVTHGSRTANAKSPLNVMALGANQDAEITIHAEGPDAEEALAALEELVNNNFGE
jgi:phosphotransferase system HPr (HPr) family protein